MTVYSYKHKTFKKRGSGLSSVPVETDGNFRQLQLGSKKMSNF